MINPLAPRREAATGATLRRHGLYGILEQVGRINSQNLLEVGLREPRLRERELSCHLVPPPADGAPIFGPSMGFEASREAPRFGDTSPQEWVAAPGAGLTRRFADGA